MKWNWKQISVAFIIGIILGAALGRWGHRYYKYNIDSPEKRFERKFSWFSQKLDLTPDQKEKIRSLFKDKHEKMQSLRGEVRPQFDAIREKASQEIRAVLNPDQIEKFNQLEEKRKKWREKRRAHRHHRMW